MEAVKNFNQELSSLYELKPPISKAKMTAITKGAIKAIKFYKHVVQSVEKFIQKCRPEYKIPGLYVIDSIVRQSRHQFGAEKDVFAPRFSKNIQFTFYHLYKCSEEEKSKVIRVLNLWQKNEVFPSDIIQPLFDLANPNSEASRTMEELLRASGGKPPHSLQKSPAKAGGIQVASEFKLHEPNANNLQSPGSSSISDQQVTQQLQTILQLLKNHAQPNNDQVKFNKQLLDFDYSDEEDAADSGNDQQPSPAMLEALQGILGNQAVLQKLKNMGAISDHQIQQLQQLLPAAQQEQSQLYQNQQIQQQSPGFSSLMPNQGQFLHGSETNNQQDTLQNQGANISWGSSSGIHMSGGAQIVIDAPVESEHSKTDDDIEIVEEQLPNKWGHSSRRRSRSRSKSRDRKRSRRSRSRSRERRRRRDKRESRGEDEYEKERQKRKEREKKGLPPIREGHLSVCSTTLWVGHLSKLVAEEDLSDLFGELGEVNTINLIPPRGCAFVCMNRRMDASKALKTLQKHKLHGKTITLAWAPGKGMKDKLWKDFWDVDLGVSYIPIDKLDPQVDMVTLEDGGMFDDETMPEWMKTMRGVARNSQASAQPVATAAVTSTAAPFLGVADVMANTAAAAAAAAAVSASSFLTSQAVSVSVQPTSTAISAPSPSAMPPFVLPPGGPPPQTGLLGTGTGAGILMPPPGAPGIIGAPPPNLLLGQPLASGPPPVVGNPLLGPPPNPGLGGQFNASQPPPRFGLDNPLFNASMPPPSMNNGSAENGGQINLNESNIDPGLGDKNVPPLVGGDSGVFEGGDFGSNNAQMNQEQPGGHGGGGEKDNLESRLRNLAGHVLNDDGQNSFGPNSFARGRGGGPRGRGKGPWIGGDQQPNEGFGNRGRGGFGRGRGRGRGGGGGNMDDMHPMMSRGPEEAGQFPGFNPDAAGPPLQTGPFGDQGQPPFDGPFRINDGGSFGAFGRPRFEGPHGFPPGGHPFGMDGGFNRGGRRGGRGFRGGFRGRGGPFRDRAPGPGAWRHNTDAGNGPRGPLFRNPFEPGNPRLEPPSNRGGRAPWDRGGRQRERKSRWGNEDDREKTEARNLNEMSEKEEHNASAVESNTDVTDFQRSNDEDIAPPVFAESDRNSGFPQELDNVQQPKPNEAMDTFEVEHEQTQQNYVETAPPEEPQCQEDQFVESVSKSEDVPRSNQDFSNEQAQNSAGDNSGAATQPPSNHEDNQVEQGQES